MKLDAYHIDFKRDARKVIAHVLAETPKSRKTVKLQLSFSFECLMYWMPELRAVWNKERESRTREIINIDSALGQP